MTDIVHNHDYLDIITAVIGILETNMIYYFVNTVCQGRLQQVRVAGRAVIELQ